MKHQNIQAHDHQSRIGRNAKVLLAAQPKEMILATKCRDGMVELMLQLHPSVVFIPGVMLNKMHSSLSLKRESGFPKIMNVI